jgi:hypothetical protein
LNEAAKGPEPQRGLAVLFDDIEMGIVNASAHFAGFLNDGVDPLRKVIVKNRKCRLIVKSLSATWRKQLA